MTQPQRRIRGGRRPNRRRFLQVAALGSGAGLLTATLGVRDARASAMADTLLLSCMDYRLVDDIERYMSGRGLRDKYDHIVLAGASLGAITEQRPAWNQTFWDHLEVAITLHHTQTVIVLDHADCGAYKLFFGDALAKDAGLEKATHATQLNKLKGMITARHPALKVETLLMTLDGKVEAV